MPDDRLFHKRLGHSVKVNRLNDAEEIVWRTYVQAADDFGVMRFAAAVLKEAHDRLAKRADGSIHRMLQRLVDVGLILTFDHQAQVYCYQADWQDYQKIRYPLRTIHPPVPGDLLASCTAATRWLFTAWPGGNKKLPSWQPPDNNGETSTDPSGKNGDFSGTTRASAPAGGVFPSSLIPDPSPFGGTDPERDRAGARADLPLVGLTPGRKKTNHANCHPPCDRICLFEKQHQVFVERFGGDPRIAGRELEMFYARVRAEIPDGPFSDKPWPFWEAHFAVAFPSIAPRAPVAPFGISKKTASNFASLQQFVARGKGVS